jgi:hypothetical protein
VDLGNFRVDLRHFLFQGANPMLELAHILARIINRAPDMTQVFKNEVFGFSHGAILPRIPYRENFLYWIRLGITESSPSRRILSFS